MHGDLLIIIDRPEFEKRLANYLAGRPVPEQLDFLKRHGVEAKKGWKRPRLTAEITHVLNKQADMTMGALAQRVLIGAGEVATGG